MIYERSHEQRSSPRRLGACTCDGIIIIKLLDPTHRPESRFVALLTRMNDYVSSPNSDARYRIIQLATYVRSNSITSRSTWPDISFTCTVINPADHRPAESTVVIDRFVRSGLLSIPNILTLWLTKRVRIAVRWTLVSTRFAVPRVFEVKLSRFV